MVLLLQDGVCLYDLVKNDGSFIKANAKANVVSAWLFVIPPYIPVGLITLIEPSVSALNYACVSPDELF
jgi:hypothetical protein